MRAPRGRGRLVVRTTVGHPLAVEVQVGRRPVGRRSSLRRRRAWIEPSIDLPAGLAASVELTLTPVGGEWIDCHVWILEGGD